MQAPTTLPASENEYASPHIRLISDEPESINNQSGLHMPMRGGASLHHLLAAPAAQPLLKNADFLASMCHEIRTPLNAIIGLAALIANPKCSEQRRTECAQMLGDSSSMLLVLLNDMLDFSKLEAGMMEIERVRFDLQKMIRETVHVIAIMANKKGLGLKVHICKSLPRELIGDPLRIRQILLNLLSNAVKYTEKGDVTLHVNADTDSDGFYQVRMTVSDNGKGMEEAEFERIFDKYTQTDAGDSRRFGGTGLGLFISQNLAGLMYGNITVRSQPGQGSHFTVTLPLQKVRGHAAEEA